MNLNEIVKLTNDKLVEEYKITREKIFKSNPFGQEIEELSRIYGLIVREVKKRSLEYLTLYM